MDLSGYVSTVRKNKSESNFKELFCVLSVTLNAIVASNISLKQ